MLPGITDEILGFFLVDKAARNYLDVSSYLRIVPSDRYNGEKNPIFRHDLTVSENYGSDITNTQTIDIYVFCLKFGTFFDYTILEDDRLTFGKYHHLLLIEVNVNG